MAKFSQQSAIDLHQRARQAGLKAMEAVRPTPMVVGSPTTPFGSDIDPGKRTYFVSGGVCGIGSIKMPANTSFAKRLVAAGIARKSQASPGVRIYIGEGGQSYEMKCAFAGAYTAVLREAGIARVYADVWVD